MHNLCNSSRFGLKYSFVALLFGLCFGSPCTSGGQADSKATQAKPDYSGEAFVIEDASTRAAFEDDGSYRRVFGSRVRIQSGAGVQRYSVISFPYQSATEALDIQYVRVRKPDGTVVPTSLDVTQDMPSEITRQAPFYSDLREKHVAVKGLGVGDVLEFEGVWHTSKPLIPGQFWYAYNFGHDNIILREQLEISVPRKRSVKWKSTTLKPTITEQSGTEVFTWTSSQLEHKSAEQERKDKEKAAYDAARGQNPAPEIQLSSFQSWEEIGRWYGSLQQDRVKPTPEIRTRAAEITKGLTDENAKIRAIYAFVSTQFRYIGVAFGVGRYQPHFANEVLSNQYGDCKDKHTLLASLLDAVGVKAYPALIATTHALDPDVPSPSQFDHVISAVASGDHLIWLDGTPEVAPFAYLIGALRDKKALLITEGKPPVLMSTPGDAAKALQTFRIDAKLDDSGTLQGKVERTLQGDDNELLLRAAFRSVPLPQWKDLVQQLSAASGFGGEVSDATASAPEKTDEPFRIEYSYTRKDFGDWPNRRIVAPLPFVGLPAIDEKTDQPSYPTWLGPPTTISSESRLELPKGYTPDIPIGVDVKEDFAEYHASHRFKDGVLISERRLIVKNREVPVGEYDAYKKFSKIVGDDYGMFIALSSGDSPALSFQRAMANLPVSENAEAAAAFAQAGQEFQNRDMQGGMASLQRAVRIDPKFTRAWISLAEIYRAIGQTDQALEAYRKAKEADPRQPVLYKALGFALLGAQKFDEAVPVWQELAKIAPSDSDAFANLGSALSGLKRYKEAAAAFESAVNLRPDAPDLEVRLGSAYLHAGEDEKAIKAYRKGVDLSDKPGVLNNAGYELAEANKQLPVALEYAEKAVRIEEKASQDVEASDLQMEDLGHTSNLAAYWDTLGWVHFRIGDFDKAEKYLNSAWTLSQSGLIADHLAQAYEGANKKQAAIHMYKIALYCYNAENPRDANAVAKTEERLEHLTPRSSMAERYNLSGISEDVNRTHIIKFASSLADKANADFFVILARDAATSATKVQGVKFVSGSEELRSAEKDLMSLTFNFTFPDGGPTRLLRRGILVCYKRTGCSLTLYKPSDVRSLN